MTCRHLRTLSSAFLLVVVVSSATRAQDADHPPAIRIDAATSLTLAGQARRVHLLGDVELYRIGLYVDGRSAGRAQLASPDVAKAIRIQVSYEEDLRRRLAIDWRRELLPQVEPAAAAHLQGSFAPLRRGDVIVIEYLPGRDTSVKVNDRVAVSRADHDLMLAFLDHWLGQRPLSEEIKRTLLGLS